MLREKLNEDIKTAMKSKDTVRLKTLRSVRAAMQLAESSASSKELDDSGIEKIISGEVKKRTEAAEAFLAGNAQERADQELEEKKILQSYLPEQLSPEELASNVSAIMEEGGWSQRSDMGQAMKVINQKLAGKAEGKAIAELVKQHLSS